MPCKFRKFIWLFLSSQDLLYLQKVSVSRSWIPLQNRKILANLNYHLSIKTSQAILKCFIDIKSSVFQKQQTQLTRGDFSRRFSAEAVMTSNVACHAMLWTENSNEHPKTRDQQKHDIEIPQNRLVWSGSRLMIVQNGWIFSFVKFTENMGLPTIYCFENLDRQSSWKKF